MINSKQRFWCKIELFRLISEYKYGSYYRLWKKKHHFTDSIIFIQNIVFKLIYTQCTCYMLCIRKGMLKQNLVARNINRVLTWKPSMMHKYHGGTSVILYNSFLDWLSSITSNELSCCTDPSLPFTCTCMFLSWWSDCISSIAERNLQKHLEL